MHAKVDPPQRLGIRSRSNFISSSSTGPEGALCLLGVGRVNIDPKIAKVSRWLGASELGQQVDQVFSRKRFAQYGYVLRIGICSSHSGDPCRLIVSGGEACLNPGVEPCDLCREVSPCHVARHPDVAEQDVDAFRFGSKNRQGLRGISSFDASKPARNQIAYGNFADSRFVLHNENCFRFLRNRSPLLWPIQPQPATEALLFTLELKRPGW